MLLDGWFVHPVADWFPMLAEAELLQLREDIRQNGLLNPIVYWNGPDKQWLIDGRNRIVAASTIGVQVATREWKGDDPTQWIISQNLHRRHLRDDQRAMIAAKLKSRFEADARRRQVAGLKRGDKSASCPFPPIDGNGGHRDNESVAKAARALNVSTKSVERAVVVQRQGTPELQVAVEAGKVSLSAAAVVATKPVDQQRTIVEGGPDAVRQAVQPSALEQILRDIKSLERRLGSLSKDELTLPLRELERVIGAFG